MSENAALHWALVDNEGTLVALVRSEHFVQLPDICNVVRNAQDLKSTAFLTDHNSFSMPEWNTWFAFGIPAIEIYLALAEDQAMPGDVFWTWEEIDPEE